MDTDKISQLFREVSGSADRDIPEKIDVVKYAKSSNCETLEDMCNKFDVTPKTARKIIEELQDDGYDIVIGGLEDKITSMRKPVSYRYHTPDVWKENPLKLGLVSDTHLGISSEYSAIHELEDTMKRFRDMGVETILHMGDITHGVSSRHKDLLYEMEPGVVSADDQVEFVVNEYPYIEGITTKFITGNHDLWVYKAAGLDVGRAIDKDREDLEYLGQEMVDIFVGPENQTRIRMHHPGGGSSYALSHKPQKFVEGMVGGTKPHLYLIGHYHKYCMIRPRNVLTIMVPGFMWNSPFYTRYGKEPEVGAVYAELNLAEDGSIYSFGTEIIPYYRFSSLPSNSR